MHTLGITLRNLLIYAACAATAANVVVPATYVVVAGIIAEQNSQPLPVNTASPFVAGIIALLGSLMGIAVIITGGCVVRFRTLWTASALVVAFPLLKLASLTIPQHLPAKFLSAWQMTSIVPDMGWWIAFGVAVILLIISWPFGFQSNGIPAEEPVPSPAKKK